MPLIQPQTMLQLRTMPKYVNSLRTQSESERKVYGDRRTKVSPYPIAIPESYSPIGTRMPNLSLHEAAVTDTRRTITAMPHLNDDMLVGSQVQVCPLTVTPLTVILCLKRQFYGQNLDLLILKIVG